ncbi:MAG: type I methionyl aminopeptidase [Deltaproteobacteria bacterium CG12_big_fil_rev_8_21_14_0_65_43_10]|nr:MAG: type I methionyl aminopeptidase [Deltaproteobacteria bacterium CG2_30_43_15]PIQ45696.1 MAG: type I methionyl aminopeptidase [Deltaproteobacteria bacterium CG12_big_fil_rev_8_21_14_0_65_43_10]PIU84771.1 MAG: type I methionyl aminopeptidase [Deltaproteobacteria bacterium CG06_land_8_20_14_3_00_44_19]PIX24626.1 MAG: type I methionyl aminopeptidase [Deltaproteobacteria bacterium CG_4_8_14_3_um_filter_43_13]PIZ19877.1 MAG: type I methionyl aminopeptidase [Deltaproteobacteria bacterium CG_4_1
MIILKSKEEIELLRKSNQIVVHILKALRKIIKPGITTLELDSYAEEQIRKKGAIPAFKGYRGFPASLCVSVNEQLVHGIPDSRRLKEGDIVSLDLGVVRSGFYGDAAITVPVGKISQEATRLLDVTQNALYKGIEQAKAGCRLHDISHAIQSWVEGNGFSVVRDFVGHGIGRNLHEEPQIPNFGLSNRGVQLKAGMVLALEPMVNVGTWRVKVQPDGWTVVTVDGSLCAHFEHTIAITEDGPDILTLISPDH